MGSLCQNSCKIAAIPSTRSVPTLSPREQRKLLDAIVPLDAILSEDGLMPHGTMTLLDGVRLQGAMMSPDGVRSKMR